jgi:hypothetical protein
MKFHSSNRCLVTIVVVLLGATACGDDVDHLDSESSTTGVETTGSDTSSGGSSTDPGVGPQPVGCFMGDMALALEGERVPGSLELGLATEPET